MGIFPFFKQREFFSANDKAEIVEAIRLAEKETSGEIRIYVESKNAYMDPIDRAAEIFFKLKMQETDHRNAVLLYIAMDHHELALFADEGIYQKAGKAYWDEEVRRMIANFTRDNISKGIAQCVREIGETLKEKFPYIPTEDKNELPDEIVFGK
ncbi:MAG: TPM domain-containing protein [Chitinophagaceae bacterium]|nr:TPM domain-containing protein [Chitinophagaceae bacterium]MBK7122617.1 TPM domain-containing protein [Chitinophagaceae bacterium]MBK7557688.1 TPM domain-containing protein [Chitinophagaceae bacterium]MBK9531360.1 TPM domain-containing protein [Chitinophagaceae bacterium]HQW92632.1 TPM domain-containing protein [Ferruginibacter sp.]